MLRRKLNQWANFDRGLHIIIIVGFILSFLLCIWGCQEYYIGKSKEELAQEMWRTDSLLLRVKWEADSLGLIHD